MGIAAKKFAKQKARMSVFRKGKSHLDQRAEQFGKYPKCRGLFEDCPKEIKDPKNPPKECRSCPELPGKYR